jgi:hypothetical protein
MLQEVESSVAAFMEQERLSGGAKGATEILRLAGVDLSDRIEQFAWAWRRRAMNSVMTIWAEDVHVVGPGKWIVAEPIDVTTRRSGRNWSAVEKPRAERRFAILREAFQTKTPLLGLLQVNRWSASQLVDEDQTSSVSFRVRDRTPWHVVQLRPEDHLAVLVRGEEPWTPTAEQILDAKRRWEVAHQPGADAPAPSPVPEPAPGAPEHVPILFVASAWMRRYNGPAEDDPVAADNFTYFTREGHPSSDAHEQWNFADTDGWVYGYVPRSSSIAIERLGAPAGSESLTGVLVVFFARDPAEDVLKVVGWYRNATVHRREVYSHQRGTLTVGGSIRAAKGDAVVLPAADRVIVIPTAQTTPGGVGQSPLWYATEHPAKVAEVRAFVDGYSNQVFGAPVEAAGGGKGGGGRPRQPDTLTRLAVEAASMKLAMASFDDAVDVSAKARGWDIEARDSKGQLLIEVKGLSGPNVNVELTPNEYDKMRILRDRYVLFVVTSALTQRPMARTFRFQAESSSWRSAAGEELAIAEVLGARAFLPDRHAEPSKDGLAPGGDENAAR